MHVAAVCRPGLVLHSYYLVITPITPHIWLHHKIFGPKPYVVYHSNRGQQSEYRKIKISMFHIKIPERRSGRKKIIPIVECQLQEFYKKDFNLPMKCGKGYVGMWPVVGRILSAGMDLDLISSRDSRYSQGRQKSWQSREKGQIFTPGPIWHLNMSNTIIVPTQQTHFKHFGEG